MKDKELLIKAIDDYDLYTKTEKLVLKTLVEINIDGIATITPRQIAKLNNVSHTVVYKILKLMINDNTIEEIKPLKTRSGIYRLKSAKLDKLIEIYEIKSKNFKIK